MDLKVRTEGDVSIVELSGKMMSDDDTSALRSKVKSLVGDGVRKIILDLGDLQWMNSSGLGVMVAAVSTVKGADGVLKVARTPERIHSLFRITRLEQVFDIYNTVEEALNSF